MKLDPYNHHRRWTNWKLKNKNKIIGISADNSKLILNFLYDMEAGRNTSPGAKKGPRSFIRLNTMCGHLVLIARLIKKNLIGLNEKQIMDLFTKMRDGTIKTGKGNTYTDVGNIVKDFKCFWMWLLRTHKVRKNIISYLVRSNGTKPSWVYLNRDQINLMYNNFPERIRPLISLMYDSGMRVTEGYNIKVIDFEDDFSRLNIPLEISKTFGRKITLTFSRPIIKKFVEDNNLKPDDRLFIVKPCDLNKYLKIVARKVLPNQNSPARENYWNISLYDIRHNSACYWTKKYKTMSGLMYRMGWKKEEEASYYHEFLGFKDEIKPDDFNKVEMISPNLSNIHNKMDLVLKQQEQQNMILLNIVGRIVQ